MSEEEERDEDIDGNAENPYRRVSLFFGRNGNTGVIGARSSDKRGAGLSGQSYFT
jgi:hypothetical protein